MHWGRWYNTPLLWLLRSPSHVLLSRFALGIRVRGRVTGRTYTLPVNYLQNGFTLLILSPRTSTWWRNLQPQAPVTFWLRGYRLKVTAQALTDPEDVIKGLLVFLRRSPRYQWSLGVPLDGHGDPRQKAQLARAASHYTLIRIPLSTAPQALGMAPAAEENTGQDRVRLLISPRHRDAPLPNSVALCLRQIAEAVPQVYWYRRSATLLY